MIQDTERKSPENKAAKIFEDTRKEFVRVLTNPLVPRQVTDSLRSILSRARLLSDEDFLAEVRRTSPYPETESATSQIYEDVTAGATTAMFIPAGSKLPKDEIIVRRSYLEQNPTVANVHFFDVMAEELAHSLSCDRKIRLNDLPDRVLALLPSFTKEELLKHLNDVYFRFFGKEPEGDPAKIVAQVRGFGTAFSNGESQEWFPKETQQMILEEARATVIQTLFEIIRLMERNFSPGQIEKRFERSMNTLEAIATANPTHCLRERAGLVFLRAYFKRPQELKAQIKDLFSNLGDMTADEFMSSLSEEESEAFLTTVSLAREEFDNRYVGFKAES